MHQLLPDIGVAVLAATLLGLVAHWTRQPIILGYLVAGAIIGPTVGVKLIKNRQNKPTLAKAPSGKAQKGRADARSRPAVHAAIHNYEGSCYIGSTRRRPWDGFTREQIFPS